MFAAELNMELTEATIFGVAEESDAYHDSASKRARDKERAKGFRSGRSSQIAVEQTTELLRSIRVEDGRAPRSLEVLARGSLSASSTPMRIASPSPARLLRSRGDVDAAQHKEEKLDFERVRKVSERNRRKKEHARLVAAEPSIIVRGFHTPGASGEDSDVSVMSTPRLGAQTGDLPSVTSSPLLRPVLSQGGISTLRHQLGDLEPERLAGRPRPTRGGSGLRVDISSSEPSSDNDPMASSEQRYSVSLENDFIGQVGSGFRTPTSPSSDQEERSQTICRKMTAEDFEPIKCLGKGAYGTVLLVRQCSTGRLFAQKQLRKASMMVHGGQEQARSERQILESVNRHPFVVKLCYAFQDRERLYLILQYAQGGELFYHLNANRMFSEDFAAFYMAEIVLALEHLHHNVGVVYRDLKPENILLDAEGHVLLTDFGLSKVAVDDDENAMCKSIVGTYEYMAPEVVRGESYGMAVDWWSLGALGVELMTGNSPFTANNRKKVEENILKKKFVPPYYLSLDAKDLLTRLLRKKPRERLGSNMPRDLQTIKKHRFFRKIDWKKLQARELEPPIRPFITDPALAENFSKDFTDLVLSPTGAIMDTKDAALADMSVKPIGTGEENVFGGFSYTASNSLLEGGLWGLC